MRMHLRSTRYSAKRKVDVLDQTDVGKASKKLRVKNDDEIKKEDDVTAVDSDDDIFSDDDIHDDNHAGLSSYEMERLANIKKNEMFFKELKMDEVKSSFQQIVGKQKKISKPERYGLKREKKEPDLPLPRRASLRLQKMDPMGIPLPESPENEQLTVSEQFKRVRYYPKTANRIGLHSVTMEKFDIERRVRKSDEPMAMLSCNNIEEDICKNMIKDWYDHCLKCQRKPKLEDSSIDIERYKKDIKKLSIADGHAAKVVPERIFSIVMHPMESKLLVFAGDKWGKVGIRDLDTKEGHDGVFLFEPHTKPINVLSFGPSDSSKVFSCSYDGTIRCGDMEKQQFIQVYATPEEDDILINGSAWIAKSNQTIMVAKNDFTAGLVDIRTGKEENNVVAHAKSVRWVDCHPTNSNYFLTTCQDGSVATWDTRKMASIKSKLSEIKCNRVASSAFFSPLTGNRILVTSLDDTIRVYDVNSNGGLVNTPKCLIRHNNQTGRWLTKFRAMWDPKTDNCFVVGNMHRPRAIDFYSCEGKGFLINQNSHDNFTSITSLNVFHPTLNVVAGGNSSGKVFIWK